MTKFYTKFPNFMQNLVAQGALTVAMGAVVPKMGTVRGCYGV